MPATAAEKMILEALSRADIGSVPRDVQLEAADRILSTLRGEGQISSHRLRIVDSPSSPRTLIIEWSATLPCPTRGISIPVAELTTEQWELASVMES